MSPIARLDVFALDCRDPAALADFYSVLTGWPIRRTDDDWIEVGMPGAVGLAFQLAPDHVPPVWPSVDRPQQAHIDFDVDDLDTAEARVIELGAVKAEVQPEPDEFRVFLDPAGHPFCLCVPVAER